MPIRLCQGIPPRKSAFGRGNIITNLTRSKRWRRTRRASSDALRRPIAGRRDCAPCRRSAIPYQGHVPGVQPRRLGLTGREAQIQMNGRPGCDGYGPRLGGAQRNTARRPTEGDNGSGRGAPRRRLDIHEIVAAEDPRSGHSHGHRAANGGANRGCHGGRSGKAGRVGELAIEPRHRQRPRRSARAANLPRKRRTRRSRRRTGRER
jgi:hypothetical protein